MSGNIATETLGCASVLWDYMSSFQSIVRCDAIVVCCSNDLGACDYACRMIGRDRDRHRF